jgi:hypothetical protein
MISGSIGVRRTVSLIVLLAAGSALAHGEAADSNEIPIESCDVLLVVRANVAGQEMRFLLDTGATTVLNLKAFSAGTRGRRSLSRSTERFNLLIRRRRMRLKSLRETTPKTNTRSLDSVRLAPHCARDDKFL